MGRARAGAVVAGAGPLRPLQAHLPLSLLRRRPGRPSAGQRRPGHILPHGYYQPRGRRAQGRQPRGRRRARVLRLDLRQGRGEGGEVGAAHHLPARLRVRRLLYWNILLAYFSRHSSP